MLNSCRLAWHSIVRDVFQKESVSVWLAVNGALGIQTDILPSRYFHYQPLRLPSFLNRFLIIAKNHNRFLFVHNTLNAMVEYFEDLPLILKILTMVACQQRI